MTSFIVAAAVLLSLPPQYLEFKFPVPVGDDAVNEMIVTNWHFNGVTLLSLKLTCKTRNVKILTTSQSPGWVVIQASEQEYLTF